MEQIKNQLDALAQKVLGNMPEEERVVAAWRYVCGEHAAEHARATSFGGGRLRVSVDDAEWLATLTHLRPQYVAKLAKLTAVPLDGIDFYRGR